MCQKEIDEIFQDLANQLSVIESNYNHENIVKRYYKAEQRSFSVYSAVSDKGNDTTDISRKNQTDQSYGQQNHSIKTEEVNGNTPDGKIPGNKTFSDSKDVPDIENNDDKTNLDNYLKLVERIKNCSNCPLHETRTHTVPGNGLLNADVMFIGEGPGEQEDKQGIPFVGKAGQLLTKIMSSVGINRNKVYISNIVKCRPPNNRNPLDSEANTCLPYLMEQIRLIQPKIIVALGKVSFSVLMKRSLSITKYRGHFIQLNYIYREREKNPIILGTFHPSAALRFPQYIDIIRSDLSMVYEVCRKNNHII